MSRNSFIFGVESLEHRLLMAVIPALPAEASAEYAPPAPHGMLEMDHAMGSADDVELAAADGMLHTVSLSVERGAAANVLMVQIHDLEQPQLVGIAGGAAAWTDSDGAVHFEVSQAARQIDLTLGNEHFLRIALDAAGRIESYARPGSADAEPDRAGNSIHSVYGSQAGLGIGLLTSTGASEVHHAQIAIVVLAAAESSAPMIEEHADGDHGVVEFGGRQIGMTGAVPTGEGMITPTPAGDGQGNSNAVMAAANRSEQNRADVMATAAQENEGENFSSPAGVGGQEASFDHETVDAVFANWAGGEEAAPLQIRAAFATESAPETLLISDAPPQPAAMPHANLPVPRDVEDLPEEFDAALDGEAADISAWKAVGAFIFSAGCAAGAYALERRAAIEAPARTRPARVRRRVTSAPASGPMAKAAM